MFALNPNIRLVTPDLFHTHWKNSRFSVANAGKLLVNMLSGTEGLVGGTIPDAHYIGTQRTLQRVANREAEWPIAKLSEEDTATLALHGITATRFPTIVYRMPSWLRHYGRPSQPISHQLPGIYRCPILDSMPKIHEMDEGACTTLSRLWDIEISEAAYTYRQRTRPAHLPKQDVPRVTRQDLAQANRQARAAQLAARARSTAC